jgi:hypothetical protein
MTTEAQRRQNRERQQRFRDRKKLSREEADYAAEVNEKELDSRVKAGMCFLGEMAPGIDANNLTDALQVAREMARALRIADVQPGESLLDFERRTFDAWANRGAPFLIRGAQTILPGWGADYWLKHCGGFDEVWTALPGSNAVIDIASLPELP